MEPFQLPCLAFRGDWLRGPQNLQELAHEERQVHPGPGGDEVSVHRYLCILERAPGAFDVRGQGLIGGDSTAAHAIDSSEDERAVAERRDGLLEFHEMPDDLLQLRIVSEIFRGGLRSG